MAVIQNSFLVLKPHPNAQQSQPAPALVKKPTQVLSASTGILSLDSLATFTSISEKVVKFSKVFPRASQIKVHTWALQHKVFLVSIIMYFTSTSGSFNLALAVRNYTWISSSARGCHFRVWLVTRLQPCQLQWPIASTEFVQTNKQAGPTNVQKR